MARIKIVDNMINPKTIIECVCTAILVFTIQVASSASKGAPIAIGMFMPDVCVSFAFIIELNKCHF